LRQENFDEETTQSYTVLTPGTTVSHYRIVKRIGLGGTGDVYLAEDAELDRTVALKFLAPRLCQDEDSKAVFRHEAQTTAKLNHPNIITIYEVGEHAGRPFFATEFVEGGSLRNYLAKRELLIHEILWFAIQVCDALSEAHANGVTHRDIKPSNILIDSRGRVKIVDFGLASVLGSDKLSPPGTITGTAKYMSPEQAQGEEVDERSDLFSFGVVLYEAITGKHPFERESEAATLNAIIEEEAIPASRYRSSMPKGLEQIVFRLLQKDKRIRYQQASDVRSDLRNVLRAVESKGVVHDRQEKPHQPSIAVLPFSNLSADKEQEYFCEGITEELINALTKIKGLRVTARTSTFPFRDGKDDVREIGRKLNVETLLEGSVRKAGNRLRITAQLIDAASGFHLWSERYDREVEDVFAIQDEIAENIARSLQVLLSEDEQRAITKVPTTDIEAYDYYLRGRQFFHQRRKKGLQFARQMFAQATELDPNFPLAYACLADCCSLLVHYYGDSSKVNVDQADRASLKALELAPDLAEAHAARGFALWLMNRHDEADQEFEIAIRLNPKLFDARYFYARSCYQRGKLVAAVHLFEEACRIHEDHEARYFAAQTYTALKRFAEAETAYIRALQAIEKHLELNPDDARAVTMGAVSWCRIEQPSTGLQWAERALDIDPEDAGIRYNVACLFALEGHHDRAIECLEDAVRAGFAHRDWVENDPDLDSLRDDPRFKALKWRD
jgi:serine/threonine protein kinase/Tfp pilus assembly protein PilF